jgi:hypothetical protein
MVIFSLSAIEFIQPYFNGLPQLRQVMADSSIMMAPHFEQRPKVTLQTSQKGDSATTKSTSQYGQAQRQIKGLVFFSGPAGMFMFILLYFFLIC